MAGSAYAFDRNWLALYQVLGGRPRPDGELDYPFRRDHVYRH
jgi:cyclopropane-fatty-acyl-phospholipid synthase